MKDNTEKVIEEMVMLLKTFDKLQLIDFMEKIINQRNINCDKS